MGNFHGKSPSVKPMSMENMSVLMNQNYSKKKSPVPEIIIVLQKGN